MFAPTSIFPNAQEARVSGFTYLIVHAECRAIENAVLQAIQNGIYTVYIINTYMTNTTINTWNDTTVASSIFTLTSHGYTTGAELQFNTTGTLPAPLTSTALYYAIVIDANTFKVASSYMNAINTVPLTITTAGTGTQEVRATTPSQDYYLTWQGQRTDRGQTTQMNEVISYFQNQGYNIYRQTNPTVQGVFQWIVAW